MLIEMKISALGTDPVTHMPFVVLKEKDGERSFPIWIGIFEAGAIAVELEKVKLNRPMTHDLLKNVVDELGGGLKRVEIVDLKDNTYYARVVIETADGRQRILDARPSDAIALALRASSPILADERVITRSLEESKDADAAKSEEEKWREILEKMRPEDFGKYKQ